MHKRLDSVHSAVFHSHASMLAFSCAPVSQYRLSQTLEQLFVLSGFYSL